MVEPRKNLDKLRTYIFIYRIDVLNSYLLSKKKIMAGSHFESTL